MKYYYCISNHYIYFIKDNKVFFKHNEIDIIQPSTFSLKDFKKDENKEFKLLTQEELILLNL